MADKTPPAFQMYPRDFLADGKQAAMTNAECGMYTRLLMHAWLERGLSTDLEDLAALVHEPIEVFKTAWRRISRCFVIVDDRFVQPRMEEVRAEQTRFREQRAEAGRASAAARNRQRSPDARPTDAEHPFNERSTSVEHEGNDSATDGQHDANGVETAAQRDGNSASATASAVETETASPSGGKPPSAAPKGPTQGRLPDADVLRAREILGLIWSRVETAVSPSMTKSTWGKRNITAARDLAAVKRTDEDILRAFESASEFYGSPVYTIAKIAEELVRLDNPRTIRRGSDVPGGRRRFEGERTDRRYDDMEMTA